MIAYLGDRAIFAVEFVIDSDQIVLQGGVLWWSRTLARGGFRLHN